MVTQPASQTFGIWFPSPCSDPSPLTPERSTLLNRKAWTEPRALTINPLRHTPLCKCLWKEWRCKSPLWIASAVFLNFKNYEWAVAAWYVWPTGIYLFIYNCKCLSSTHMHTFQFAPYVTHFLNFLAPLGMWVHHPRLFSHIRLTTLVVGQAQFPRSFLEFTTPRIHCQIQYVMYNLPLMAIKDQSIPRFSRY